MNTSEETSNPEAQTERGEDGASCITYQILPACSPVLDTHLFTQNHGSCHRLTFWVLYGQSHNWKD